MGSIKAMMTVDGSADRESCRRLVEEWLSRDLRRLLRLPSMPLDTNGKAVNKAKTDTY